MSDLADFRGARGSNSGDQFHELWALEQILALLVPETRLKSVTVEGIPVDKTSSDDEPHWDSVDCALFYGGETFKTAEDVELVQLKYSSDPTRAWTVSRLTENLAKKGNNSVLRKLADDYRDAKKRMKVDAKLKFRLVSNQSISNVVLKIFSIGAVRGKIPADVKSGYVDVTKAIGLKGNDLSSFFQSVDFSECGCSSRFSHRERVILAIASLIEGNAATDFAELNVRIRELMLGERYGEFVTAKTVLSWFDVADPNALFPCPQKINSIEKPIQRDASKKLVDSLLEGHRLVYLHGPGGCGKTTTLIQVKALLPESSCFIVYDCFGGGQYLFADEKRHAPENAFLQIVNELALELGTPFLIPRGERQPFDISRFLKRVADSATVLGKAFPDALLVIAIDAADNAVTAATRPAQIEKCFVHELCSANIQALPSNVRIIISARSARVDTLLLPKNTPDVTCPPFSLLESADFVRERWPGTSPSWAEEFHHYSNGIPRVQGYAAGIAGDDPKKAIEVLQPGKGLKEVLRIQFEFALQKIGQPELFESLIAALAILPPPIPPKHLAVIARTNAEMVYDLVNDLSPGFVVDVEGISIADEDFEDFIGGESRSLFEPITNQVADHLLACHEVDAYAATHVADALVNASRNHELLPLIERSSSLRIITDPVIRREVQLKRLRLALYACRQAGSSINTIKAIIVSADANKDEESLQQILSSNPDLAVYFAWPTLRRLVLSDSDKARFQGSILAQDAVRAARVGDRITARERLLSHDAWLQRRNEVMAAKNFKQEWKVTDDDITARAEAIYSIGSVENVLYELQRWNPKDIPLRVGLKLIPLLIARGHQEELTEIAKKEVLPGPWNLFLLVPLALAGVSVGVELLAHALSRVRTRYIPKNILSDHITSAGWKKDLFATILTACELAVWYDVDKAIVRKALNNISSTLDRKFSTIKPEAIDASIRIWLLDTHLDASEISADKFLESIKPEELVENSEARKDENPAERRLLMDRHEKLSTQVRGVYPIYVSRLSFIAKSQDLGEVDDFKELIPSVNPQDYLFDRDYESKYFRAVAAMSVLRLMAIPDVPIKPLFEKSVEILAGKYVNQFGTDTIPFINLLLLRKSEHPLVLEIVSQKTSALAGIKSGSSEKTEAQLSFSRLLLSVSPDDSEALFAEAVELTKELDYEAFDQIKLLHSIADFSAGLTYSERRRVAAEASRFISGAAERLDNDQFPWEEATSALTRLSCCVGLAAISRWADDGIVGIEKTLDSYLADGLSLKELSPEVVAALMILMRYPCNDLVIQTIKTANNTVQRLMIASEFASDCLLHKSTEKLGNAILSCVRKEETDQYPVLNLLCNMLEFINKLPVTSSNESEQLSTSNYSSDSQADGSAKGPISLEGRSFTTSEAIREALDSMVGEKSDFHKGQILEEMRRVTLPSDRVKFLNALVAVELDYFVERNRADVLLNALKSWPGPAIERWKTEHLPQAVVKHFGGFCRWIEEQQSPLPELLLATNLPLSEQFNILAEGIENSASTLRFRTLYALIQELIKGIPEAQVASLITWYVDRLAARIPVDERHVLDLQDIPTKTNIAVGRFLYSLMADIDTRIRWRAAHALRRLARLHADETFNAVISCCELTEEKSFQYADTPFYGHAARLWLVMAINRISIDCPSMVVPHLSLLAKIAEDAAFPHVLIQEHAKRAILKIAALNRSDFPEIIELATVHSTNVPRSYSDSKHSYRSFGWEDSSARHFHFDATDTLRYWYQYILRIFPSVDKKYVLDLAEQWIVDKWKAPENAHWWDLEPRKKRYDERRYNLWSHRHGHMPTIERNAIYLEWHAMFCVVGELLKSHPVSEGNSTYDSFSGWLESNMPTLPNEWFSDLRQPTPLESIFWALPLSNEEEWLNGISSETCIEKLANQCSSRVGWIVVACGYETQQDGRRESTRIYSALIDTCKAATLLTAIKDKTISEDFYVPGEDLDNDEVDTETTFSQTPWLMHCQEDMGFDRGDPILNGRYPMQQQPGRIVTEYFDLIDSNAKYNWHSKRLNDELVFTGEIWSDREERDEQDYVRMNGSDGWRLWMNTAHLQAFLQSKEMSLVCEVSVTREVYSQYSDPYESKTKKECKHKGFFVCRDDGGIETGIGKLGKWN